MALALGRDHLVRRRHGVYGARDGGARCRRLRLHLAVAVVTPSSGLVVDADPVTREDALLEVGRVAQTLHSHGARHNIDGRSFLGNAVERRRDGDGPRVRRLPRRVQVQFVRRPGVPRVVEQDAAAPRGVRLGHRGRQGRPGLRLELNVRHRGKLQVRGGIAGLEQDDGGAVSDFLEHERQPPGRYGAHDKQVARR